MREAVFERKLGEALKAAGFLYLKFVSPGQTGLPDRIILSPSGRAVFCELKMDDGVLSARQRAWIKRLESRSVPVYVVRPGEDAGGTVRAFVDELIRLDAG